MTRDEIRDRVLTIFAEEFEIVDPGLDDDLREAHGFDSIDAIELLREIEERELAAAEMDRLGRPDRAEILRAEAGLVSRYVD